MRNRIQASSDDFVIAARVGYLESRNERIVASLILFTYGFISGMIIVISQQVELQ